MSDVLVQKINCMLKMKAVVFLKAAAIYTKCK